jgi:hypothetical protein
LEARATGTAASATRSTGRGAEARGAAGRTRSLW